MTVMTSVGSVDAKVNAAALFEKLGLRLADERPILESWRKANIAWRQERRARIAMHARRVQDHLRRFKRTRLQTIRPSRATTGQPKAVWCIELRRKFRTLTEAAEFVNRSPSNINQALRLGVRCGPYHWEAFRAEKHDVINQVT